MNIGDKVYCIRTDKVLTVKAFTMVRVGRRDVMKVVTNKGERFYDELVPRRRLSDTWYGRLLGM